MYEDIVYAVVYSLLLLNTDLHVAQGNHARMTRQAFVRNTMSTIIDQQQTAKGGNSRQFTKAWEMEMEAHLKVKNTVFIAKRGRGQKDIDYLLL